MQKCLALLLVYLFSSTCYAGIETELLLAQYGECTIRITHDATPDAKTGVLIVRSYKPVDGIHRSCSPAREDVSASLVTALRNYNSRPEMKPITSIMIGRLMNYDWITHYLDLKFTQPTGAAKKLTHQQFNEWVAISGIIQPFQHALEAHGYRFITASCEKQMFYKNGIPKDGLCWLIVEKAQSGTRAC